MLLHCKFKVFHPDCHLPLQSHPPLPCSQQDFQPGKSLWFPTTRNYSCLPSVPHLHQQFHQAGLQAFSFPGKIGGHLTTCSLESFPFALPTRTPLSSGACQSTIWCVPFLGNSKHSWQTVFLILLRFRNQVAWKVA